MERLIPISAFLMKYPLGWPHHDVSAEEHSPKRKAARQFFWGTGDARKVWSSWTLENFPE